MKLMIANGWKLGRLVDPFSDRIGKLVDWFEMQKQWYDYFVSLQMLTCKKKAIRRGGWPLYV